MDRQEFAKELDVWLGDFRSAAMGALDGGCAPNDTLRIAQLTADSKANKRASDRQRLAAPIEIAGGRLPRA
jgi:hypothetical protein